MEIQTVTCHLTALHAKCSTLYWEMIFEAMMDSIGIKYAYLKVYWRCIVRCKSIRRQKIDKLGFPRGLIQVYNLSAIFVYHYLFYPFKLVTSHNMIRYWSAEVLLMIRLKATYLHCTCRSNSWKNLPILHKQYKIKCSLFIFRFILRSPQKHSLIVCRWLLYSWINCVPNYFTWWYMQA